MERLPALIIGDGKLIDKGIKVLILFKRSTLFLGMTNGFRSSLLKLGNEICRCLCFREIVSTNSVILGNICDGLDTNTRSRANLSGPVDDALPCLQQQHLLEPPLKSQTLCRCEILPCHTLDHTGNESRPSEILCLPDSDSVCCDASVSLTDLFSSPIVSCALTATLLSNISSNSDSVSVVSSLSSELCDWTSNPKPGSKEFPHNPTLANRLSLFDIEWFILLVVTCL